MKYIHFAKNIIHRFFFVLSFVSFKFPLVRFKEYMLLKLFSTFLHASYFHTLFIGRKKTASLSHFPQSQLSDYYFLNNLGSPYSKNPWLGWIWKIFKFHHLSSCKMMWAMMVFIIFSSPTSHSGHLMRYTFTETEQIGC